MTLTPLQAIYLLWPAWAVSWFAAGRWANTPTKQLPRRNERGHLVITALGFLLLFAPMRPWMLWTLSETMLWAAFGAALLSFAFCWWARIEMGRLWAPLVSRTAEHRIVDTGPFRLVRHPIYTGLIGAAVATAAASGHLLAVFGAALVAIGFWMKGRLEETFLRQQLGAEAYDAYARRVPMLIPFGPK